MPTFEGTCREYRVEVEGLAIQFVTSRHMEQTLADGRERVAGLMTEGLKVSERVDPILATGTGDGARVRIVDRMRDDIITRELSALPGYETLLMEDIPSVGTFGVFRVADASGITVGDVLHVGTEAMEVTAITDNTVTARRAVWGTTRQRHYVIGAYEADSTFPRVSVGRPNFIEGRRAWIYEYVDPNSADLQGDGELLWRGVVTMDARLGRDASTWSFRIDPIYKVLEDSLGGDLERLLKPRGIYIPSHRAVWGYVHWRNVFTVGSTDSALDRSFTFGPVYGFFEDNTAMVEALNDAIDAANPTPPFSSPNWAFSFEFVERSDGLGYQARIECVADPKDVVFNGAGNTVQRTYLSLSMSHDPSTGNMAFSSAEGGTGARAHLIEGPGIRNLFFDPADADYPTSGWVLPDDRSRFGEHLTPRGFWGFPSREQDPIYPESAAIEDEGAPPRKIYLNASGGSTAAVSALTMEFAGGDEVSVGVTFDVVDNAFVYSGSLAGGTGVIPRSPEYTWRSADDAPDVTLTRDFLSASGAEIIGHLGDFRDAIVAIAPELANSGGAPFLLAEDVAAVSDTVVSQAGDREIALRRKYIAQKGATLAELLAHEARLLGCYWGMNEQGALRLIPLRVPTAIQTPDFEINASTDLADQSFATWERGALGHVNSTVVRTGWNLQEEEHTGPSFEFRDVKGFAERRAARQVEIAPRSFAVDEFDARTLREDLNYLTVPARSMFAKEHALARFEVPYTVRNAALIGSVCSVTAHYLPNIRTGRRGLENERGIVIGRQWDLHTGRGVVDVLLFQRLSKSWAPDLVGYINADDTVDGNTVDIFSVRSPAPSIWAPGGDPIAALPTGTRVAWHWFDDATTAPRVGTVVGVTEISATNFEVDVTWDAAMPAGKTAGDPNTQGWLTLAKADDPLCTAFQLENYAYHAEGDPDDLAGTIAVAGGAARISFYAV